MVSEPNAERQLSRRSGSHREQPPKVEDPQENMSEDEERTSTNQTSATSEGESTAAQPGIVSRISTGVYDKTASVVSGVSWITGAAFSTSYNAVSSVGNMVLRRETADTKSKSE